MDKHFIGILVKDGLGTTVKEGVVLVVSDCHDTIVIDDYVNPGTAGSTHGNDSGVPVDVESHYADSIVKEGVVLVVVDCHIASVFVDSVDVGAAGSTHGTESGAVSDYAVSLVTYLDTKFVPTGFTTVDPSPTLSPTPSTPMPLPTPSAMNAIDAIDICPGAHAAAPPGGCESRWAVTLVLAMIAAMKSPLNPMMAATPINSS